MPPFLFHSAKKGKHASIEALLALCVMAGQCSNQTRCLKTCFPSSQKVLGFGIASKHTCNRKNKLHNVGFDKHQRTLTICQTRKAKSTLPGWWKKKRETTSVFECRPWRLSFRIRRLRPTHLVRSWRAAQLTKKKFPFRVLLFEGGADLAWR